MQYGITTCYPKTRNGRTPNETTSRKMFATVEYAEKTAVKQRAKGKYVNIFSIFSSKHIIDYLIQ